MLLVVGLLIDFWGTYGAVFLGFIFPPLHYLCIAPSADLITTLSDKSSSDIVSFKAAELPPNQDVSLVLAAPKSSLWHMRLICGI